MLTNRYRYGVGGALEESQCRCIRSVKRVTSPTAADPAQIVVCVQTCIVFVERLHAMPIDHSLLVDIKKRGFVAGDLAEWRTRPILALVQDLHAAFTSDDQPNVASAAVGLFWRACFVDGQAVGSAPSLERRADLDSHAVGVVVMFLASKTQSYATADEAFEGLHRVVESYIALIPAETVAHLGAEWLSAAAVQRQGLTSRGHALQTLEVLATRRCDDLVSTGSALLEGFLEAVDEERDPTNVLRSFKLNALFALRCDASTIAQHAEDLFDAVSVYFPIMFSPPPNCAVTKADLRSALHVAMSLPPYRQYALPFLTNKLSAAASVTKADSVDVIRRILAPAVSLTAKQAIREQAAATIRAVLPELLTGLRSEVLRLCAMGSHGDASLLQAMLSTLNECATVLNDADTSTLLSCLRPIVDGGISSVETGNNVGPAYATMLHAAASSTPFVFDTVANYTLPLLGAISSEPKTSPQSVLNAAAMNSALLAAAEKLRSHGSEVRPPSAAALHGSRAVIAAGETLGLTSSTASFHVAEALSTLCALGHYDPAWFSDSDAREAYRRLATAAVAGADADVARRAAKAAANAMRVDTVRGAAEVEAAVMSLGDAAQAQRVLTLCDELVSSRLPQPCVTATSLLFSLVSRASDPTCVEKLWQSLRSAAAEVAKAGTGYVVEFVTRLVALPPAAVTSEAELTEALQAALISLDEAALVECITAVTANASTHVGMQAFCAASPLKHSAIVREHFDVRSWVHEALLIPDDGSGSSALVGCLVAHCDVSERSSIAENVLNLTNVSLAALSQVAKGLCMKGDELGQALQKRLLDLAIAGSAAAPESVASVLAAPKPTTGTAFLWEQRFFFTSIASLRAAILDGNAGAMETLRLLVTVAPDAHIGIAAKELVEVACSSVAAAATQFGALFILGAILRVSPDEVLNTITHRPDLLRALATAGCEAARMTTRAECFKMLTEVAKTFPTFDRPTQVSLIRARADVVAAAKPALNDDKRVVRKEAAACRHYWILMSDPR
jgi:hypothetical protein